MSSGTAIHPERTIRSQRSLVSIGNACPVYGLKTNSALTTGKFTVSTQSFNKLTSILVMTEVMTSSLKSVLFSSTRKEFALLTVSCTTMKTLFRRDIS